MARNRGSTAVYRETESIQQYHSTAVYSLPLSGVLPFFVSDKTSVPFPHFEVQHNFSRYKNQVANKTAVRRTIEGTICTRHLVMLCICQIKPVSPAAALST